MSSLEVAAGEAQGLRQVLAVHGKRDINIGDMRRVFEMLFNPKFIEKTLLATFCPHLRTDKHKNGAAQLDAQSEICSTFSDVFFITQRVAVQENIGKSVTVIITIQIA